MGADCYWNREERIRHKTLARLARQARQALRHWLASVKASLVLLYRQTLHDHVPLCFTERGGGHLDDETNCGLTRESARRRAEKEEKNRPLVLYAPASMPASASASAPSRYQEIGRRCW